MVSRSNLSGRPKMGGVLGKVFKPQRQRPPKVTVPPETGGAGLAGMVRRSQARAGGVANENPGGGVFSKIQSTIADAKERQAALPARGMAARAQAMAGKKRSAMQPPVAGEQKRGPRREPTAGEQARATRQAVAGMRGQAQAQAQQTGMEKMSETQEEMAARQSGFEEARAGGRGILSPEQEAARNRAALETTGEAGGTRTEVDVTEPSLNQARRQRSRSGRIYRR